MFRTEEKGVLELRTGSLKAKVVSVFSRKVLRNIFWLSFDRIFRLLLSLFVGAAVARYLGPVEWGKFNYVLAFVNIAMAVATMGLDGFLIKEWLENPQKKNGFLGTAFVLRCCTILLSLIIILTAYKLFHLEAEYYAIFALLFLSVAVMPFDLIDLDFQSELKSKKSVQAKSIAYMIGSVIKVAAIILKMPVVFFAAILGFEAILACLLLIRKYNYKDGNLKLWRFDSVLFSYILKKAWPFLLSAVSVILYMRLDQIMLGNLLNPQKVGEFTAAVRISEIFLFIPIAICGSFYSSLLNARNEKLSNNYAMKVQQLFNIMFLLGITIAVIVFLFSKVIVYILYGNSFVEASHILRIHIWSLIAIFLGVAGNQYLVIENLQKFTFYATLIGLATNIILNIFLIPRFGGVGAAYATLISQSFSAIFSNLVFKKSRGVFICQIRCLLLILKPRVFFNDIKNMI